MRKLNWIVLWLTIGMVTVQPLQAGWRSVLPKIQMISDSIGGSFDSSYFRDGWPLGRNGHLAIFGLNVADTIGVNFPSVAWCAQEMKRQLDPLVASHHVSLDIEVYTNGDCLPVADESNIVLGLWPNSMHPDTVHHFDPDSSIYGDNDLAGVGRAFWYSEDSRFQFGPGYHGNKEEYYIWVEDIAGTVYITAATHRGLAYAVSSFCQAVDVVRDTLRVREARIIDYPQFPMRMMSAYFKPFIGSDDSTGNMFGFNSLDAADSITVIARDCLYKNKANGLFHGGGEEAYDSTGGMNDNLRTHHWLVNQFLHRLGNPVDGHDSWRNFGFDWYEEARWERHPSASTNQAVVSDRYPVIQNEVTCSLTSDGLGGYYLVPQPNDACFQITSSQNSACGAGDFEDLWGGNQYCAQGWELGRDSLMDMTKLEHAPDAGHYAMVNFLQDNHSTLECKTIKVNDHWGKEGSDIYPSRQMIVDFVARLHQGETNHAKIRIAITGPTMSGRNPDRDLWTSNDTLMPRQDSSAFGCNGDPERTLYWKDAHPIPNRL
jgi:hypothetical protein